MEKLINRVKLMILQPKAAWEVVKTEETTVSNLLTGYLLPLTLIPTIASFIGFGLVGINVGFFGHAANMEWGINQAITTFASTFIGVIISAWVISQLAPKFEVSLTMNNAIKLVVYAYTPSLVAGVFNIIPSLAVLGIIGGLYSLYVLYIGFKPMTNVSEEKNTSYFLISIVAIILVSILLTFIFGAILTTIGFGAYQSMSLFQ